MDNSDSVTVVNNNFSDSKVNNDNVDNTDKFVDKKNFVDGNMSNDMVDSKVNNDNFDNTDDLVDSMDFVDGNMSNDFVDGKVKDDYLYNMNHGRRGLALVFNHFEFESHLTLPKRSGTNVDKETIKSTLARLGFDVQIYDDLTFEKLTGTLEEAARVDHSDADCILIVVLSHGVAGILFSKDKPYPTEEIWKKFENCQTLVGKPKLFFIQACQGPRYDHGTELREDFEQISKTPTKMITLEDDCPTVWDFPPLGQDVLIFQSTIPGFFSWRNQWRGSWFVQALGKILKVHGPYMDLVSNLTRVSRLIATGFESNTDDTATHGKKQIPIMTSTLLKEVYFNRKTFV